MDTVQWQKKSVCLNADVTGLGAGKSAPVSFTAKQIADNAHMYDFIFNIKNDDTVFHTGEYYIAGTGQLATVTLYDGNGGGFVISDNEITKVTVNEG